MKKKVIFFLLLLIPFISYANTESGIYHCYRMMVVWVPIITLILGYIMGFFISRMVEEDNNRRKNKDKYKKIYIGLLLYLVFSYVLLFFAYNILLNNTELVLLKLLLMVVYGFFCKELYFSIEKNYLKILPLKLVFIAFVGISFITVGTVSPFNTNRELITAFIIGFLVNAISLEMISLVCRNMKIKVFSQEK